MPTLTGHPSRALVCMDDQQLGMPLRGRRRRMDVELAETSTECLVLIEGEHLISKENHLVIE